MKINKYLQIKTTLNLIYRIRTVLPINEKIVEKSSKYRVYKVAYKTSVNKIGANQIVKKKWEIVEKASARSPDKKHL